VFDRDIDEALTEALGNFILSRGSPLDPDDLTNDRFIFVCAKNVVMNRLRILRREVPLKDEIRIYPDDEDAGDLPKAEEIGHSGNADQPIDPTNMMDAVTRVLLSLSEDKREFILDYVQSGVTKSGADRQKAWRIMREIKQMMGRLGCNPIDRQRREGGE
jgi:DNA-directed RNA polymerase specialized sigma24 family protein